MNTASPGVRNNLVFWLMWLLPGSAVLAGVATLAIAMHGADRALPAEYHWEGAGLDADFARASTAGALGVAATLEIRAGECAASLRNLASDPVTLNVLLTHGSDAGLDRRVRLTRAAAGQYRAACARLEAGKWRIAIDDDYGTWALRGSAAGAFTIAQLQARSPGGTGP